MLSAIILAQADERPIVATLASLVPASAAGLVRDVCLVARPPAEMVARVADVAGCNLHVAEGPNGALLAQAAKAARANWLLFLRAGAIPEGGWIDETAQFMEAASLAPKKRAALFRYARSPHSEARMHDAFKAVRRLLLGPSADQGLLISRAHYEALGGHPAIERAEAKLLSRLRRHDRILLRSRLVAA